MFQSSEEEAEQRRLRVERRLLLGRLELIAQHLSAIPEQRSSVDRLLERLDLLANKQIVNLLSEERLKGVLRELVSLLNGIWTWIKEHLNYESSRFYGVCKVKDMYLSTMSQLQQILRNEGTGYLTLLS